MDCLSRHAVIEISPRRLIKHLLPRPRRIRNQSRYRGRHNHAPNLKLLSSLQNIKSAL
ncbi:hypothetical protein OIU77_024078 [Salix suchowensis]|uniref:Uncharacterized protein n=1 Tax=Salix suchowensis TaxID=1278906 RepID=A0ABQ9C9B9_9ROSI|nr:hypothetical protein OIU77_024078 [Salix suchowensis]